MSTSEYGKKHRALGLCRNCTKSIVEGSAIYCDFHRQKNRESRRITERKSAARFKEEIFKHYGKMCECCGEDEIEFLTLEHKLGNGNTHRKKLFKHNVGGVHMYRWLKRNGFPKEYAVLCMNCNWAKRYQGVCPHKLRRGG